MFGATKWELRIQWHLLDCIVYNVCFKFPILLCSVQNYKAFQNYILQVTSSRGFISLHYKICSKHKVCLLKKFSSPSLHCVLVGPLGIKTALSDYKNCIWVASRSVESIGYQDSPFEQRLLSVSVAFLSSSIGYQDGPFELRTAFEVTRDSRALDFLRVLHFELRLCFKSFYKFHSFQNHVFVTILFFYFCPMPHSFLLTTLCPTLCPMPSSIWLTVDSYSSYTILI